MRRGHGGSRGNDAPAQRETFPRTCLAAIPLCERQTRNGEEAHTHTQTSRLAVAQLRGHEPATGVNPTQSTRAERSERLIRRVRDSMACGSCGEGDSACLL